MDIDDKNIKKFILKVYKEGYDINIKTEYVSSYGWIKWALHIDKRDITKGYIFSSSIVKREGIKELFYEAIDFFKNNKQKR